MRVNPNEVRYFEEMAGFSYETQMAFYENQVRQGKCPWLAAACRDAGGLLYTRRLALAFLRADHSDAAKRARAAVFRDVWGGGEEPIPFWEYVSVWRSRTLSATPQEIRREFVRLFHWRTL